MHTDYPEFMGRGFYDFEITGVVCPDCGSGGGSRYPCWCHKCNDKVLMLPCTNGFTYVNNWSEHARNQSQKLQTDNRR